MEVNYQRIYEHAGYLFYSIAAADGIVKEAEVGKLKERINDEWLPLEDSTDEFGTDAAHYIFITFDNLLDRGIPAEEAFSTFKDYFSLHKEAFSQPVKKRIYATASSIANAFAGKNKVESAYLKELRSFMK